MAITIHQQPDVHSAISTPLIITASSTNSGNDGFMYVVRVTLGINNMEYKQSPNPLGSLVFNLSPCVKSVIRNRNALTENNTNPPAPIHKYSNLISDREFFDNAAYAGTIASGIVVLEGFSINGVFTVDEDSAVEISPSVTIFNYMDFSLSDGFKPNLLDEIGHKQGGESRIMSDRQANTHDWPEARFFGLADSNVIYIPSHESDHGQWGVLCSSTVAGEVSEAKKVRLSILPNSGPPVQEVYDLNDGETLMSHMPLYPANLNASTLPDIIKPQDYPNWKAIYFQILNEADEQVSMTYVMYNAERFGGCLGIHNKIRLAWVGRRGGWEYFNFTKKSNESYVTEKKIAQRSIGNAADVSSSVPFTFNSFDESTFIVDMKVEKYLTANSDYLSDGEFEFLKGLFLSKQVHWVHDDGTHTPVIVQADGYEVKREHGGATKFAQDIKLLIAQEQFN